MKKLLILIAVLITAIAVGSLFEKTVNEVRVSGTSNFGDISLTGNLTTGGSYATTTSSSSNSVLFERDIMGYSTVVVTGASSTATTVVKLPATSTITTLIPNSGDTYRFTIVNATTTGVSTLTLTTNTGITMRLASSTPIIPVNGNAEVTLIRKSNTDVIANVQNY